MEAAPFAQQEVQQEQLPVQTQPLAGDTAMFPGLSGDNPVAVEFEETCIDLVDTLGQLQLHILARQGRGRPRGSV
jgi:hypothetical protein